MGLIFIKEIHTNVLDDIISKWIPHKMECILGDLGDQLDFLGSRGVVNAALQNTTAMSMSPYRHTVLSNSIEDELETILTPLQYVVVEQYTLENPLVIAGSSTSG